MLNEKTILCFDELLKINEFDKKISNKQKVLFVSNKPRNGRTEILLEQNLTYKFCKRNSDQTLSIVFAVENSILNSNRIIHYTNQECFLVLFEKAANRWLKINRLYFPYHDNNTTYQKEKQEVKLMLNTIWRLEA